MMAYRKNGFITRMDRIAMMVTGQDTETGLNPRLSILAHLVFMATGTVGLVLCAQGEFGPDIVFGAVFFSSTHAVIVEQLKRGKARLDEREWGVFWKSMAIGASVPCVLVAIWAMLLAPYADQGMWHPDRPDEWMAVGSFILGLMTQITNIAMAWMTPAYAAELLEED